MWRTSLDADFRARRDDVLHVYDDTPTAEHVICVDEKPSIQALERRHPDLPMAPGNAGAARSWGQIPAQT